MKLTTTVTAPVLDMFSSDWEFDGKKGTSHFVVIYDFENHTSERLIVDINNDKLFQLIGNIELRAAGCAHLTAGRGRKVRHMEAMAAARMLRAGLHCHALARQRRQSRPRRRKKIDGEQQQRYGPFQFHLLFHDSAFGEARDPPPGILPGRVGVDLVTFGEQQRGIRSRKLASPQLLPQIHRRRIERHDACHIGGASAPRHHDHVLAGHLPDFEFFAYLHLSNVLIFAKV